MEQTVWAMGLTRIIYAVVNLGVGLLIWKLNDPAGAMKANAVLGSFVGPLVFVIVSGLGMAGLAKAVSPLKMVLLVLGVIIIMIGASQ